jgi:GxxExxY protein
MLNRTRSVLDTDTEELVTRVIGCALRVHRELGPGYLESIYHDAMAIELEVSGLRFDREVFTPIRYRDRLLRGHRLDLVVERRVVVELKAVERLEAIHTSQVVSYLKASGLKVALLMNFNTSLLMSALKRIVF